MHINFMTDFVLVHRGLLIVLAKILGQYFGQSLPWPNRMLQLFDSIRKGSMETHQMEATNFALQY